MVMLTGLGVWVQASPPTGPTRGGGGGGGGAAEIPRPGGRRDTTRDGAVRGAR